MRVLACRVCRLLMRLYRISIQWIAAKLMRYTNRSMVMQSRVY
jgi:hypothetical protein